MFFMILVDSGYPKSRLSRFLIFVAISFSVLLVAKIFLFKESNLVYDGPIVSYLSRRRLNHPHGIGKCPPAVWVSPFRHRTDLGEIAASLGYKVAVELGVQEGKFFESTVRSWKSLDEYVLVDLWSQQKDYIDAANVPNDLQTQYMKDTIQRGETLVKEQLLKKFTICRNYTVSCAKEFPDKYFDFIYIDARHDYKGVMEDLVNWWPKLKAGGMMAGHDYMENREPPGEAADPHRGGQNWAVNYDGTVDPSGRAVRGAVDDFFSDATGMMHGCPKQIVIEYRAVAWNTWAVRK